MARAIPTIGRLKIESTVPTSEIIEIATVTDEMSFITIYVVSYWILVAHAKSTPSLPGPSHTYGEEKKIPAASVSTCSALYLAFVSTIYKR